MNQDQSSISPQTERTVGEKAIETRYVGYCDILGFSNRILSDFENTLEAYKEFGELLSSLPSKGVELTMYSDAVLVTSDSLAPVLSVVQNLWFCALVHDLMLRGAITVGKYWELRKGNHMLVASDALARAVMLERSVGIPAVVISDDIEIPDALWTLRFVSGPFGTPVLHFRDRNIVNPFNYMWGVSAHDRVSRLMNASPAHKDKYLWFLSLYEAVRNGRELIPAEVFARFVREGILKPRPTQPNQEF